MAASVVRMFTLCIPLILLYAIKVYAILGIGDLVLDPSNLVQNTWQAYRGLQSNVNEVLILNNQTQQIAHDAKNLLSIPKDMIAQIEGVMSEYYRLYSEGQGYIHSAKHSLEDFQELYRTLESGGGNGTLMMRAQRMLAQVKRASQIASEAQRVYDQLGLQQAAVKQVVRASQSAQGQMQVQQATNHLLQVMHTQYADMQKLQTTLGQAQVAVWMRDAEAQRLASESLDQWLVGWPTAEFRGPGQGLGSPLPR